MINKLKPYKKNFIVLNNGEKYLIKQVNTGAFFIHYNNDIIISFMAEGRSGGLYFKINHLSVNNRIYQAQRYHYKYTIFIREIATILLYNNYLWDYETNEPLEETRIKKGYPILKDIQYQIGYIMEA